MAHFRVLQAAMTAVVLAGCGGGLGSMTGGTTGTGGAGTGGGAGSSGASTVGTAGTAGTCEYSASHSPVPRFSLLVTLPDGSVQSCATLRWPDGGGGPSPFSGEISGSVTEIGGTAFSLDTCAAGTGCSPNVYRFEIDAPDLTVAMPLGRPVTVTWRISSILTRACARALVINDGLPSSVASGTWPALWLAASESTVESSIPVPFAVVEQVLSCNPNPGTPRPCGPAAADDYALVFTPTSGEPPLSLATGKTGTLVLTTAPGTTQHLTVRNLRSYQTANCDDYWNWAWWVAGHGGAGGG